jgi:hypothetical protein
MLSADHTDTTDQMNKLKGSGIRLNGMPVNVGNAITVKECHSDRKERLLAIYTKKYLDGGCKSKAEAEVRARADDDYEVQFEELVGQLRDANVTIQKFNVEKIVNDDARSLLSASKGIRNDLMG